MGSNKELIRQIRDNGWHITDAFWTGLSDYGRRFVTDELAGFGSRDYYTARIKAIGFVNKGRVLDVGCGYGQWSVVLSEQGNEVKGIDPNEEIAKGAGTLLQLNGVEAPDIRIAGMESMPFDDGVFDGIVCYSAIMHADYAKALNEFHRVLKKGGHAYISTDSMGWLLHQMMDRGLLKGDFAAAARYLRRIYRKRKNERKGKTYNLVVTRAYFRKLAEDAGFRIVDMQAEGRIATFAPPPPSRYPEKYYGFESIVDVLIEKI